MKSLGNIPSHLKTNAILDAIGENIILADENYNIVWLNPSAVKLLSKLAGAYGAYYVEDVIGMNMDDFHLRPEYQRSVMKDLQESHRARINIKNQVITDIVIDPIQNENEEITGYVVMLMDVTSKAEEEEKREKLINELSVPLLKIWENALALPLAGSLDIDRFDLILTKLLGECQKHSAYFVVLDLTGVIEWHDQVSYQLDKMITGLNLMGTECLVVGIKPDLARQLNNFSKNTRIFTNMKEATKYIISG